MITIFPSGFEVLISLYRLNFTLKDWLVELLFNIYKNITVIIKHIDRIYNLLSRRR